MFKGQLTDHLKTACFYHENIRSYKLLNLTTTNKTLCKVRTFPFVNKACDHIGKVLTPCIGTIMRNKIESGYYIVSGVNCFFCLLGNMKLILQTLKLSIYCLIP